MGFVRNVVGAITGSTGADAAEKAGELQYQGTQQQIAEAKRAAAEGQTYLAPYADVGKQALGQTGFLTDPNAQFSFLQNNPLFKMALENANQTTLRQGAAGGRLSSGDTLQRLSSNVLLQAQPMIQEQKASIMDLLGFGGNLAQTQANTAIGTGSQVADFIGSGAAARAAGVMGAANARQQGFSNLIQLGGMAAGAMGGFGGGGGAGKAAGKAVGPNAGLF
jgi:hypothetical protein